MEPTGPDFEPNFGHAYAVVLDKPYEEVFRTIGTPHGHDRVTRLSKLCVEYTALKDDEVLVPSDVGLQDVAVCKLEPVSKPLDPVSPGSRILNRQSFKYVESVPVVFGLFHVKVTLNGTICWDETNGVSLYETETNNMAHIRVWKCRRFEREGDSRTKITEVIKGNCPSLMRKTVQGVTETTHRYHPSAPALGLANCMLLQCPHGRIPHPLPEQFLISRTGSPHLSIAPFTDSILSYPPIRLQIIIQCLCMSINN